MSNDINKVEILETFSEKKTYSQHISGKDFLLVSNYGLDILIRMINNMIISKQIKYSIYTDFSELFNIMIIVLKEASESNTFNNIFSRVDLEYKETTFRTNGSSWLQGILRIFLTTYVRGNKKTQEEWFSVIERSKVETFNMDELNQFSSDMGIIQEVRNEINDNTILLYMCSWCYAKKNNILDSVLKCPRTFNKIIATKHDFLVESQNLYYNYIKNLMDDITKNSRLSLLQIKDTILNLYKKYYDIDILKKDIIDQIFDDIKPDIFIDSIHKKNIQKLLINTVNTIIKTKPYII